MKKIVALVLALALALSLCTVAFAADEVKGDVTTKTVSFKKATLAEYVPVATGSDVKTLGDEAKVEEVVVKTHNNDVDTKGVKTVYADVYVVDSDEEYAVVSKDLATAKLVVDGKAVYLMETTGWAVKTDKVVDKKIEAKDEPSCGDYNVDVYMIDGKAYATKGDDWALLNGAFVKCGGEQEVNPHQFNKDSKKTYDKDANVDSITCAECKKVFSVVKASKVDKDWEYDVDFTVVDGLYIVLAGGKAAAEAGKDVTSAKTFDAGVAMYVGLSLASVAGSAVVIGKKKEF